VVLAIGRLGHLQLAEQHSAGLAQPSHNGRILSWPVLPTDRHAGRGWNALRIAEVLDRDRNALQRTATEALPDFVVGQFRLLHRQVGGYGGVAFQAAIKPPDSFQYCACHLD